MLLLCALVAGSSSVWGDDYVLYSGTITEGDYIIVYDDVAMKNAVSSNRLQYEKVTISNNKISNSDATIVWHIAASGDYWTIYNANVSKYAASTGAKNKAQLLDSGTDDMSKWTVNGTETYEFVNKKNAANNVNSNLRYNSGYGFACYATGTGGALSLYKKQESSGEATTVTIDDSDITHTDIAAGTAAGSLSAVVKNSSSVAIPSATVTWSSSKPAVATIDATTGVVTLVKKGSTTITASYAGVENTYLSSSDTYVLNVTNSAANDGSSEKPFTPSEAKDAYDANELNAETEYYVTGIIQSVISYNSTDKSLNYWISDDGTTTNRMESYKGKGLNGADFDSAEDLEAGDIVTIKGKLKIYNSTFEFDEGNQITALTQRTKVNLATLTFEPTSLVLGSVTTATATATLDVPACTTATLTYESLDEDIATCTSAGVITAVAKGDARIKVTLSVPSTDPNYKLGTVKTKMETITVANPSHTATFSVNGVTTEESFEEGEDITFPANPAAIGGKSFVGWTTEAIESTTATAPTFVTSATMGDADVTYYAVFANEAKTTGLAKYTLDYSTESNLSSSTNWGSYGKAYEYTASDGGTWTVKAYKNQGIQLNTGKDCSIKVPVCSGNIQSIEITCSAEKAVGFSANNYSGTGTITYLADGTDATSQTLDLSTSSVTTGYIVPKSGSTSITKIIVNYLGEVISYNDYCTTVVLDPSDPVDEGETVTLTTTENMDGWRTFYDADQGYTADDNTTVYVASDNTATKVILVEIGSNQIPANTPVILKTTDANRQITLTKGDVPAFNGINALQASAAGQNLGTVYRLGYGSDGISFYKYTTTSAPAGVVYVPNVGGGNAPSLSIEFGSGATSIETIKSNDDMREVYNLNGQRVAQPTKGLYIVNGHKVVIK